MESLSPQARARLAAFRHQESPDRAVAERCLAALEARLADNETAADDHEAPAANAGHRRRLVARVAGALAVAAGLLLALTWAVMPRSDRPAANVAAPYQLRDGEPATQRPIERVRDGSSGTFKPVVAPAQPVVPVTPPEPATVAAPAEKPVSSDGPRPSKRPARSDDDIALEVDLLRRAKLAAPAARLELLDEHARRFPSGKLAAERGLLKIEALCALGDVEEARALARRFPRRFPGSPLSDRAATLCSEGRAGESP